MEEAAAAAHPGSGAIVMGTGIVSTALSLDGEETLSRVLLALAAAVWLVLGLLLVVLVLRRRAAARDYARSVAALTGVAGTNVVAARVYALGWHWLAAALLALGLVLWLGLLPVVLANLRRPTVGVSFVLTVATESLAVAAALLAVAYREPWLAVAALVALALGLALYVFVALSFDLRQLLVGRGDHWITGGALAIATLACGLSAEAAHALPSLHAAAGALDATALALWAAAALWLPALLVAELASPRLGYDVFRWATVFPFGMYAACSFVVADATGIGGLADFARVWVWVAFVVWLLVAAGLVRRLAAISRR